MKLMILNNCGINRVCRTSCLETCISTQFTLKSSKPSSKLHLPHLHPLSRTHPPRLIKIYALDTATTSQSLSTDDSPTDLVEIGLIRSSHGVYGEMKVEPLTDFPEERLGVPGPRWLQSPQKPKFKTTTSSSPSSSHRPVTLEYGRTTISKGNEVWIVKLEEINSPEEVSTLKGYTILIPKAARPQLEDDDEFYSTDLVGMSVSLLQEGGGGEIGVVVDIFDGTGTHDVLRIKMNKGISNSEGEEEEEQQREEEKEEEKYVLLPFAKEFVPEIDLDLRRMKITPPEGLLELAAPIQKRERRQENAGKRERRKSKTKKTTTAGSEGGGEGDVFSKQQEQEQSA